MVDGLIIISNICLPIYTCAQACTHALHTRACAHILSLSGNTNNNKQYKNTLTTTHTHTLSCTNIKTHNRIVKMLLFLLCEGALHIAGYQRNRYNLIKDGNGHENVNFICDLVFFLLQISVVLRVNKQ